MASTVPSSSPCPAARAWASIRSTNAFSNFGCNCDNAGAFLNTDMANVCIKYFPRSLPNNDCKALTPTPTSSHRSSTTTSLLSSSPYDTARQPKQSPLRSVCNRVPDGDLKKSVPLLTTYTAIGAVLCLKTTLPASYVSVSKATLLSRSFPCADMPSNIRICSKRSRFSWRCRLECSRSIERKVEPDAPQRPVSIRACTVEVRDVPYSNAMPPKEAPDSRTSTGSPFTMRSHVPYCIM
mmetsp:Transcript_36753/g.111082  ORF Transcript_36753/g.111082 Transcript_36753/m.111082 type:complete len:238 (-) Transcript_36753:472-1185(-)